MTDNKFEFTAFDCAYITDHEKHKDYPFVDKPEYIQEIVDLLNEQDQNINKLIEENEQLKLKQDKNNFEFEYHKNYHEWDKDKLLIEENQSRIELKDGILTIRVYLPDIKQIHNFKYRVVGVYDRIIEEG